MTAKQRQTGDKTGGDNTSATSSPSKPGEDSRPTISIDLRQPFVAAVYAWLFPGAGHIYQKRYGKGFLFMACVLSLFFFGLALGEGRVVYIGHGQRFNSTANRRVSRRLIMFAFQYQIVVQGAVGLPAAPAIPQYFRVKNKEEPLWGGFMAPPREGEAKEYDELARLHENMTIRFELGTLYTLVAGLLNILVIYDAYSGPMVYDSRKEEEARKKEGDGD